MKFKKKGQVWVETVLYTLIGLALIGVVLAIITPKINETKDKITVEQAIESLNVLDEKINDVLDRGAGNIRIIPIFTIKRGSLYINSSTNAIIFEVDDLRKPYSEIGTIITVGKVKVSSEEGQKFSKAVLTLNYENIANLKYLKEETNKKFTPSSTPYKFSIQNLGKENERFVINIDETSRRI